MYFENYADNVKIEKRRLFFKRAIPFLISIPMNQREIGKQRNVYLVPVFPEQNKTLETSSCAISKDWRFHKVKIMNKSILEISKQKFRDIVQESAFIQFL